MIYIVLGVVDSGPFAVVHNHWACFQECLFPGTICGIPYLSNPLITFPILTSTSVKGRLKSLMGASIHLEDQSLSWLPIMLHATSHPHTFVYHKSITDKVTRIPRKLAKRYHSSCQFRLGGWWQWLGWLYQGLVGKGWLTSDIPHGWEAEQVFALLSSSKVLFRLSCWSNKCNQEKQRTGYLLYRFIGTGHSHKALSFSTLREQRKLLKVIYIDSLTQKKDPKQNPKTRDL